MKKLIAILSALLLISLSVLLVACIPDNSNNTGDNSGSNSGNTDDNQLKQFTNITFTDKRVTYDGTEQSIEIAGNLPEDTTVTYTNNKGIDAGTYSAKVTLTKDGYQTTTLSATLTIDKAQFVGITLENKKFLATGQKHSLEVQGELPQGTTVTYTGNEQSDAGEYTVTATLSNKNYYTKTLTATMTINKLTDAVAVVNQLLVQPSAWSYVPTSLHPQNMAYSTMPNTDFSSAVNVNSIATKPIGLQMNVMYDLMSNVDTALSAAQFVFNAGTTIADAYQRFINGNPEDVTQFDGSVNIAGSTLKLRIVLQDDTYILLAGNDTISLELKYDGSTDTNIGRIQVTNNGVLKYESTDNTLRLAVELSVSNVSCVSQVIFTKTGNTVVGHMYEFMGVGDTGIKTSALIYSDAYYTYITANKRQSNDLMIDAYQEVYSSTTGEYIGGEIAETVGITDYDTLWLGLDSITGINTVKVTTVNDEVSIYLNGSAEKFQNKKVITSRRFDIEVKEIYYMIALSDGDSVKYECQKATVPMLFVQKEYINDFTADVQDKNNGLTLTLPNTTSITQYFQENMDAYLQLKELVTREEVVEYIGENNPFFGQSVA